MIVNYTTFTDTDEVDSYVYQTPLGAIIPLNPLASLRMQARLNAGDPTVWIDLSTANANYGNGLGGNGLILVTNAAAGAFTVTIPLSILLNLPPATYVHSLVMTDPVFLIRTEIWRGTLVHSAGPTRWTARTL